MKLAFITALGGLVLLIAPPALAQPIDPPPPGPAGAQPPMGPTGGFRGGGRERMLELREALKLRPDQEGAFTTYVAALRPDPGARGEMRAERERMAAMTPDQRRAERQTERQSDPAFEAMRAKRQEATRAFMAALTPAQQDAFQTFRREHRPAGGMGGGGYGGGGGQGMGGSFGGPGAAGGPPPG